MAFSEFETFRYSKIMEDFTNEAGPPKDIAHELKWKYEINSRNQSVELFEVRPMFMEKSKIIEIPFAKVTYVKSTKRWKIYWMRANGNWLRYEPEPDTATLEEALKMIKEDKHFCFFG